MVEAWRWRAFGNDLAAAEAILTGGRLNTARRSQEIHLLTPSRAYSARILDDRLEVEKIVRRSGVGLEQWAPSFSAGFPLSRPDLVLFFESWGAAEPDLPDHCASPRTFLDRVAAARKDLLPVPVVRLTERYSFQECAGEISELAVGKDVLRSIALESPHPGTLLAAVRALGRSGGENVNTAAGLRQFLRANQRSGPSAAAFAWGVLAFELFGWILSA